MNVGDLRKALDGLPDEMPVVVEVDLGEQSAQAEVTDAVAGDNALLLLTGDSEQCFSCEKARIKYVDGLCEDCHAIAMSETP